MMTILQKITTMCLVLSASLFGLAQTTTNFTFTGGSQTYTVPTCVTSISITVAGASGGANGGAGAVVTATIPVNPGDVITVNVGGQGTFGAGGWGGGGNGWVVSQGGQNSSGGGGGASSVLVNGTPVVVAGGGGGGNGGSTFNLVSGGAGGCGSGAAGNGSVFTNTGGGGGSQTSGGAGGPPWGAGQFGQPGSFGQGGNGGNDPNFGAPGGGGGGGYYGGGGGGGDNCCTGANGGGAGGGGSSLVPAGSGCVSGGNVGNGSVSITANTGIAASNDGPYCVGESIQLFASNGASSYSWTGPNGFTSTAQNPVIPAATLASGGTYSVVGTGVGCTEPAETDVVVVAPPTPNAGPDDVICLGEYIMLNGTESVAANTSGWSWSAPGINPAPTVSYNPNASYNAPAVMVNQPGTYTFTFSENNGICPSATDNVQIIVSQTNHTTSFVSPSCAGMSDGSITINNPDAIDYSYDMGGSYVTNSTQGGFPVGTYTVISRNQYGCTDTSDVTITEPAPILISAGNDTLICENGTANMWASINAAGMNEFYHWNHDPGTANTSTISPLANTTVEVYAEAANGCFSDTTYIQVDVRPGLTGSITGYDTICPGYPTTIGVYNLMGGIGAPYDISWNSGEMGSGTSMNVVANPPSTYMYIATITDACESTPLVLNTEVYVAPLPVPMMSVVDPAICEPAVFEVSNMTDPAMVQSYVWILSDGQTYLNESPFFTEEMYHGQYDVQLIVTSPLGCIDSVTNYDFLTVYQKPVAGFQWSPNPIKMFNTDVDFANQSFLGYEYLWTFQDGIPSTSMVERPHVQFPDGVTGDYEVTLYVTSEHGCMDTITRIVNVLPEVIIYAPTAFTPDGDEWNQNWKVMIEGIDVYSFHLTIFNRWGEIIWESFDKEVGWDGTYGGQPVPTGTYTWKIEARDAVNDGKYEWNGHINLLK